MQKLIGYISKAIAVIFGYKQTIESQRATIAEQAETINTQATAIETLKKQVDDDAIDDAALEEAANLARQAAEAATARVTELQAEIDAANLKGEELAQLLTEDPETPSVDANFKTV